MHHLESSDREHSGPLEVASTAVVPPEVCECCYSDLVQPVSAETDPTGAVRLTIRCPECDHVRTGECSWDEAQAFGRHFAKGRAELRAAHDELAEEVFRDELDCLVLALHADLIGPDDFTPFRC